MWWGGRERERKDCMPATVGVPPVSSGTEDPFNLSTMPRKKHASPRGLCHPSAKKNQNIPHSGFAFETDDLTCTTWFSNPFFSLRLFLSVDVTQSGPAYPATLACRSDADLNQHAPCFFFFHINVNGKTHITESGAAKHRNRFSGTQKGYTEEELYTVINLCSLHLRIFSNTHTHTHKPLQMQSQREKGNPHSS